MAARKKGDSAKASGLYCVAGGPNLQSCKNSSCTEGISMHLFPADHNIKRKWINFVRRHRPTFEPTRYSALCSIHFEASCFHQRFSFSELGSELNLPAKRRLERDAIPSIHDANESPLDDQNETLSDRSRRQVSALYFNISDLGVLMACVSGI